MVLDRMWVLGCELDPDPGLCVMQTVQNGITTQEEKERTQDTIARVLSEATRSLPISNYSIRRILSQSILDVFSPPIPHISIRISQVDPQHNTL